MWTLTNVYLISLAIGSVFSGIVLTRMKEKMHWDTVIAYSLLAVVPWINTGWALIALIPLVAFILGMISGLFELIFGSSKR